MITRLTFTREGTLSQLAHVEVALDEMKELVVAGGYNPCEAELHMNQSDRHFSIALYAEKRGKQSFKEGIQ